MRVFLQVIKAFNSTGRPLRTILSMTTIWFFIFVRPTNMVTSLTPPLCPQHPPTDCQVALKRVTILFNFTKTQSNLPDTNY